MDLARRIRGERFLDYRDKSLFYEHNDEYYYRFAYNDVYMGRFLHKEMIEDVINNVPNPNNGQMILRGKHPLNHV